MGAPEAIPSAGEPETTAELRELSFDQLGKGDIVTLDLLSREIYRLTVMEVDESGGVIVAFIRGRRPQLSEVVQEWQVISNYVQLEGSAKGLVVSQESPVTIEVSDDRETRVLKTGKGAWLSLDTGDKLKPFVSSEILQIDHKRKIDSDFPAVIS